MTASTWKQVHIAFWKWWLLHKKQPILLLAQLLWPCLILCALVWLHPLARPGAHTSCYFHARANPSVGLVPYFQTTMCNLNNMCFDKGRHQDIPTFPNSSFTDIVLAGEPLFNSNEVKEGILVFPQALEFLSAAVRVMDDSFIQEILDDNVQVYEMLRNTTRIEEFLIQNGGLTIEESNQLINATLKLANIFIDFGGQALKPIACQPDKLANYLISDETEAVLAISQALCQLENDQISQLVDLIQNNIDIESLIRRGENLVNRTSSYGPAKITKDVTLIIQAILNMTIFQGMTSKPVVLNTTLWKDDFERFLTTILDSNEDIDYQILDTLMALTLEEQTFEVVQNVSLRVSKELKTLLDWINEKDEAREKRQASCNECDPQGELSGMVSQLERLAFFAAEVLEIAKCFLHLDQKTCGDVNEAHQRMNEFMLKYPNIQCFIEKLTRNDDDWLILRLDELVVGKILETVMNHQMNSWTDFEHCMENVTIDDLNGQQFETGRFVFCAIIYEPFQLLPDFIKTQDMTGCKTRTLDLYQFIVFIQDFQNVLQSILKGTLTSVQNPATLFTSQIGFGNLSLGFNVTLVITDKIVSEAEQTLAGIIDEIDVGPEAMLPLSLIIPNQQKTAEFINEAIELLLVILRDWSTQVSTDNQGYIREAIVKSMNASSCPESFLLLANFSSSNELIGKSGILCNLDKVAEEWLSYDLFNNIHAVVMEAQETGHCTLENNAVANWQSFINALMEVLKNKTIVVPEAVLINDLWHQFQNFIMQVFQKLSHDNLSMFSMTDYYSDLGLLDQVLQCWKPYYAEPQVACKSLGDLAIFGTYAADWLQDIDARNDHVITRFLNNSNIFETIGHSTSLIKSMSQVINVETLESLLAETDLDSDVIQLLVNAYINLNRLIFQDFNVTADMLENKMEFQRLIKLDNLNDVAKVGIATRKANKEKIAKALQKSLEMDEIALAIENWKEEEVKSFHWVEEAFKLAQVMMDNSINIVSAISEMIKVVDDAGADKYLDMISSVLDLFSKGRIDSLVNGILEVFATTDVMIGNDPVAQNVQILLEGLHQLEIYQILTMLQFETSLDSLFKNWHAVEKFLQQLNLSSQDIKAVQEAELNIPGILTNSKGGVGILSSLPAMFCQDLTKYIILNATQTEETDIQEKLCNLTDSKKLFDMTKIVIEEIELEKLVQLSLIIDNILMESNLTRHQFNEILEKLQTCQTFIDENWNLMTDLIAIFQPVLNVSQTSDTTRELGLLICDDSEAFKLIQHSGYSFASTKSRPSKDMTPCDQLSAKLNESEEGKFFWKLIEPYLAGDILYAPVNDLTEAIIKEANRSASTIGEIMQKASAFMTLGPIGITISSIEKDLLDAQKILSSTLLTQIINSTADYNLGVVETFIDVNITSLISQLHQFDHVLQTMEMLGEACDCYKIDRFIGVANESQLEAQALSGNQSFLAGLVFLPTLSSKNHHIQYKIRMSKDFVPSSAVLKSDFWVPGPDSSYLQDLKYASGFLQLQDLIDRAIMRHVQNQLNWQDYSGINLENVGIYTQEFPYPCFIRENFLSALYTTQMLNVAIVIGFALLVGASIRQQIWEKESLNAMVLEVMGYNLTINWIVWFLINLMLAFAISGLITIILTRAGLLQYSDPFVVFLFLACSSLATVSYCFMMSSLMSKAVTGSIVSLIFYVMSFTPFMGMFTLSASTITLWPRLLASLLMTSCFGYGFNYITTFEQQSIGINWMNVRQSAVKGDALNLAYCCLMLLFDALLYSSVAVIFMLVGRRSKRTSFRTSGISPHVQEDSNEKRVVGVALKDLTKVFETTTNEVRTAVNGISMEFYVNEVTALLGHNGAGKSTLIKMLSGMLEPTSGKAEILGFDTWTQWTQVQTLLGICPQQSILYPSLSPEEHLGLYGSLKGILSNADLKEEIAKFIECMEMQNLASVPVRNLSEGMKRRLCVALAFIGGSKVVILDEPTSGVDPIARRHIWRLINQLKCGKTIIFTTHHLDEAELLSDKLVMIHKGSLIASGTVAEMKQQFGGIGFELIINHTDNSEIDFVQLVKRSVENATALPKRHENDHQCSRFKLPLMKDVNNEEYNQLERLFGMLDNEKDKLGIDSYKLECTSLEQIFLKMQDSPHDEIALESDTESTCSKATSDSYTSQLVRKETLTGAPLLWNQIQGLLHKRWLHSMRDWRYLSTILIFPTLLLALSMGLGLLRPSEELPPLLLTPSTYGPFSNSFIQIHEGDSIDVMKQFLESPGIGTTCMNDLQNMSAIQVGCQDSLEKNFTAFYEGPGPMNQKCECNHFVWSCQSTESNGTETPSRWIMNTTDVLFNLQDISANDWLLQTHQEFIDSRFGGWSIGSQAKESSWINGSGIKLIAWYNNKAPHALPAYTNAIHNALLRALIRDQQERSTYGISTFSHPMKLFNGQLDSESLMQRLSSYGVSLMVLLSVGFLPSGFITYVIGERTAEEKQVQLVSGVSKLTYWGMTFLWNFMIMLVFMLICIALFYGFALTPYVANLNLPAVCTLIMAFWIDCAAISYLLESFFQEPSFGQLFIICSNIVIGLITLLTNLILQMLWWNQSARNLNRVLSKLFLIFPQFALGGGLLKLTTNQVQSEIAAIYDIDSYENPFNMNILGLNIIALLSQAFIFHALHLMLEFGWFRFVAPSKWLRNQKNNARLNEADDDVVQEQKRIEANNHNAGEVLRIENLTKIFHRPMGGNVYAVDNVTLGIKSGECFGWLGLNGAGKSTTFKLLTGQMEATSGGFSLHPSQGQHQSMGYCPQTDALDPYLTVKETLDIYAKLKGIPGHLRNEVVKKSMKDLDLTGHSGNRCQSLSGGTKRKLCTAVALMGSPELILMDEPTSGMDAVTKRLVWRRIQREIAFGDSAVVLTSHSMEECEFLCTRIAIMAQGKFKCLGSPNHLMNKFGNGYSVCLYFEALESLDQGMSFVASRFPLATHVQRHNLAIQFRVANEPPSVIFGHILANKEPLGIQDFAVRHTTLDEVFINFANDGRHSKSDECFTANLIEENVRRPPSGASQSASMSIDLPDKAWSQASLETEVAVALVEQGLDEDQTCV